MQRYEIFSNSQLYWHNLGRTLRCLYQCKDTKFLAIHNWSKSTNNAILLFIPVQRYEIFSNSQPILNHWFFGVGCLYQCKDTKFLAIHNSEARHLVDKRLFIPVQRYEIFSNSQPWNWGWRKRQGCLYQCKDTKFLAIHNMARATLIYNALFIPVQRYEIFSNSQHTIATDGREHRCLYQCKDTKFLAIHNHSQWHQYLRSVVYTSAKIRNF